VELHQDSERVRAKCDLPAFLRVDFQGSRVTSDGGLLHDLTAFFSPHAEGKSAIFLSALGKSARMKKE
jgi:hypothetical protein